MTATLLAVDDSKTMRKVLEMTFAGEDYRVVLAEDSAEALAKLRSERPAVAVVDGNLGDESGYDLCQKIKREAPTVGVILLSSRHHPFDRARAAGAGVDDFIDKPFDTQQLIDKVAGLLKRAAEAPPAGIRAPVPQAVQPARQPVTAGQSVGVPTGGAQAPGVGASSATRPFGAPPVAGPVRPVGGAGGLPAGTPAAVKVPPRVPTSPMGVAGPTTQSGTHTQPAAASAPAASELAPPRPAPSAPKAAEVPPAPAAGPARAPAPTAAVPPAPAAVAVSLPADLETRLETLGLTREQVQGVLALSKDVVEKVVWEVVPTLAEILIKEEIRRLTAD